MSLVVFDYSLSRGPWSLLVLALGKMTQESLTYVMAVGSGPAHANCVSDSMWYGMATSCSWPCVSPAGIVRFNEIPLSVVYQSGK